MAPLPVVHPVLQHAKFTLDIFSVAGFFGGDEVVEAMSTLHIYQGRRWRGWYNSPGAYTVAKRFGRIANSRFWRGFFTGSCQDPTTAFGLNGKEGPKYIALYSGTVITTKHAGYLLANYCKQLPRDVLECPRKTMGLGVTIIDITNIKNEKNLHKLSVPSGPIHKTLSYFTMLSSVACTIFSLVLFNDRFCFVAILFGTIIGGISSLLIGRGNLALETVFKPADGSPPGDGVLIGDEIIVLRGSEEKVNAITKGNFRLELSGGPTYHVIGVCSMLYFLQFIVQLLLIPQGNLAGQLMFLASFVIAWINNSVLASIDKEELQTKLLLEESVTMEHKTYQLSCWSAAIVFACLSLSRSAEEVEKCPAYADYNRQHLLNQMLPNDTEVWVQWKDVIAEVLQSRSRDPLDRTLASLPSEPKPNSAKPVGPRYLREDQQELFRTLLKDALWAYEFYDKLTRNEDATGDDSMRYVISVMVDGCLLKDACRKSQYELDPKEE